ncbi:hypothetical protein GCM10010399_81770 [Dactylosporangium fulvum]|uniref:Uncharacterized protein n=1 Tax=Dactylosporangium fulvum TaxID=53359 RepID=A0ABY5WAT9_9ACTN|nr:hypothetical protein [Dactylosporangium fulvum]UWP87175.1 hypothetical protein Dfulv_24215 [Dactylosporangium fulvum]
MNGHAYQSRRIVPQLVLTRVFNRIVRVTHRLVGFGAEGPPEPLPWAELATERTLRRIARQAEAQFDPVAEGRPAR